jgi:hypothetical protein
MESYVSSNLVLLNNKIFNSFEDAKKECENAAKKDGTLIVVRCSKKVSVY